MPADEVAQPLTRQLELVDDFGGVAGAARLADGSIAVADGGLRAVRIYDRGQSKPRILGRVGSGPGEFQSLYRLHYCGDTLVAYDFNASRLQLYGQQSFARQVQLPAALIGADFVGCAGTDSLYFVQLPEQIPGLGTQLFPLTVFRLALTDARFEWMTTLRGTEMHVSRTPPAFYDRPFGQRTLVAAGPGGAAVAETQKPMVQILLPDRQRLTISLPGRRTRSVEAKDRSLYLSERLAAESDTAGRATIRAVLSGADWGKTVPVLDQLVISRTGSILLRMYPQSADTTATWLMVSRTSPLCRRFQLARSSRLVFADSMGLIVVAEASDGTERVQLFSFGPVAPTGR